MCNLISLDCFWLAALLIQMTDFDFLTCPCPASLCWLKRRSPLHAGSGTEWPLTFSKIWSVVGFMYVHLQYLLMSVLSDSENEMNQISELTLLRQHNTVVKQEMNAGSSWMWWTWHDPVFPLALFVNSALLLGWKVFSSLSSHSPSAPGCIRLSQQMIDHTRSSLFSKGQNCGCQ